jgi:hypothetical protein
MADSKVTDLAAASTPLGGTEVIYLVQGGLDTKSTVADVVAGKANLSGGNSFTGTQNFGQGVVDEFEGSVKTVTSFPYTLLNTDTGKIMRFNSGTDVTVNLPDSLDAGWNIAWSQSGVGVITFTTTGSATRNNRQGHTKTAGQYAMGSLVVMTNTGSAAMYNLSGDTKA